MALEFLVENEVENKARETLQYIVLLWGKNATYEPLLRSYNSSHTDHSLAGTIKSQQIP